MQTLATRAIVTLLPLAGLASVGLAQAGDRPPAVRDVGFAPMIVMVGLFAILVALAVVAQTIPSKRGHQD